MITVVDATTHEEAKPMFAFYVQANLEAALENICLPSMGGRMLATKTATELAKKIRADKGISKGVVLSEHRSIVLHENKLHELFLVAPATVQHPLRLSSVWVACELDDAQVERLLTVLTGFGLVEWGQWIGVPAEGRNWNEIFSQVHDRMREIPRGM